MNFMIGHACQKLSLVTIIVRNSYFFGEKMIFVGTLMHSRIFSILRSSSMA